MEKLLESQENVFAELTQILTQSSHSTNVADSDETQLQGIDNLIETAVEESEWVSHHKLRSGKVIRVHFENSTKERKVNEGDDEEMKDCSQESVSMLQGCCEEKPAFPELQETCADSELELIELTDDDEPPGEVVDVSTQTDFPSGMSPGEDITKHAGFVGSVIKLQTILSSKKKISSKDLWSILNFPEEDSPLAMDIQTETIAYLLRSTNAENVLQETVRILLTYLENVLEEDLWKLSWCWENSVYEMVVKMLNEAVDSEPGIRKLVDSFLDKTIESILRNEPKLKNLALESKAMFLTAFCQSIYLSYTGANCMIGKLKILKTIDEHLEKTTAANLTKNSYYLIRTLEKLLETFKTKLKTQKGEDVLVKDAPVKNYDVLNMWKKHWNKEEVPEGDTQTQKTWKVRITRWCHDLDDLFAHCVTHLPVSSMALERCVRLAKDILRICYPEMNDWTPANN